MATAYPSTFRLPRIEGFGASVDAGLISADGPTDQVQRRVYETMPHVFTMTFVMPVAEWSAWHGWVRIYGFRWFEMSLPSMYAGLAGAERSPILIRFTSPVITASMVADNVVSITVTAEMAPSMIADYLGAA